MPLHFVPSYCVRAAQYCSFWKQSNGFNPSPLICTDQKKPNTSIANSVAFVWCPVPRSSKRLSHCGSFRLYINCFSVHSFWQLEGANFGGISRIALLRHYCPFLHIPALCLQDIVYTCHQSVCCCRFVSISRSVHQALCCSSPFTGWRPVLIFSIHCIRQRNNRGKFSIIPFEWQRRLSENSFSFVQ